MELQVFNSTEFGSVRTATVNGEVMFVGKDVADILGYQNGSRDINRHVDEEDRHKVMLFDGNQDKETIIINESGLYSLILSSKMPNAKKFKHWVTSEVLPAIRKHGMYAIDEILENPDLAIAALTQLKEERERRKQLECLALVQRQQIAELQPKANDMNELYELAKQIDVLIIFYFLMGAGIYGIVSTIMNGIWLIKDSVKKYKAKKKSAEETTEE